jgi:hypothetical protein
MTGNSPACGKLAAVRSCPMSTVSTVFTASCSAAGTALRSLLLCAPLLLCPLTQAQAQPAPVAETATTAPHQQAAAPINTHPQQAAGRSRAEVIAELVCARASGELEALVMRSYGLPTPPLRMEACAAEPKTAPQPAAVQTAD